MMLAGQKAKSTTQVDLFLVEKSLADYRKLDQVANEYPARGANVQTRHGECGAFLDEAIAGAAGASLFLFLDPCGANLPWGQVVDALKTKRTSWPRTEALLNFSAGLTRRAGGQIKAGQFDADGVKRLDKVLGGDWWRDVALRAHLAAALDTLAADPAPENTDRAARAAVLIGLLDRAVRNSSALAEAWYEPLFTAATLDDALATVPGSWVADVRAITERSAPGRCCRPATGGLSCGTLRSCSTRPVASAWLGPGHRSRMLWPFLREAHLKRPRTAFPDGMQDEQPARHNVGVKRDELAPVEVIALDIARCDMHYTATSLFSLSPPAAAAEVALLQYAVMAAYEAQVHFAKTTGWRLQANWDWDTAQAARTSVKFFADKMRNLDGVIAHFDDLLKANHRAFYPPTRRAQFLDFLRDDLSVVTRDSQPYTSLVSAHYLTGRRPDEVADLATIGPALLRLSTGVGNVAGQLLTDSGIAWHEPAAVADLAWFDGRAAVAMPRLFGGELGLPLAAALMTVHGIVACAAFSASRALCGSCEAAARKHRFIALFQSLNALKILMERRAGTPVSDDVSLLLGDPESAWILNQSGLRNGLVHLGLQDIASGLPTGSTVDDATRAYTRHDPDAVADRVSNHLVRFVDVLTDWMLSPTTRGDSFMGSLHPAS